MLPFLRSHRLNVASPHLGHDPRPELQDYPPWSRHQIPLGLPPL